MQRFNERAKKRDPMIEVNLSEVYEKSWRDETLGMNILNLIEGKILTEQTKQITQPIWEYMLKESELQYRDYYESDDEE